MRVVPVPAGLGDQPSPAGTGTPGEGIPGTGRNPGKTRISEV